MSVSRERGNRWGDLGWGALVVLIAAIGLLVAVRWWAARVEASARRTWDATMAVSALASPQGPRSASASALRLEENAARIGIDLVPRAAARSQQVADVNGALDTLHAHLVAQLGADRSGPIAPALAGWLEANAPSLDALAVELLASDPPRWETPQGRVITRRPAPLARADRLVVEAARLAGVPASTPLSDDDAHLSRPGTPRLDGAALLDEALVLVALSKGRAGDGQGALRALAAAARLEDGLAEDADIVALGVVSNLARLRLAALRDLALPIDAGPLLGPALEPRLRPALLDEARAWAREVQDPPARRGFVGRVLGVVLEPPSRAAAARTLENLHGILRAVDGPRLGDAELATLASDARASAPGWDTVQRDYLGEIVAVGSRLRRADLEAEFTRRFLAARSLLALTGDARSACEQAMAGPGERSPAAFECRSDAAGRLVLVPVDLAPSLGGPAPFEPDLASSLIVPAR